MEGSLLNPATNIRYGTHYLSQLSTYFHGNPALIAAAHNAGRVTGLLIRRVQPLEGVPPMSQFPTQPFPLLAKLGYGYDADKVGKE